MYLCIDIGGTKTLIALMSPEGKLMHSVRFETIARQTEFYAHLVQQIRVNFALSNLKMISVAVPGIVKRNHIINCPNLPWRNFALAEQLKADFNLPVVVENDANLAALAEARNCSGRSIYLTFSTGIGGGIVENGTIVKRYQDFEPGHVHYTYKGVEDEWEHFAAARAINNEYHKLVTEITETSEWEDIVSRMLLGLVPLTTSIKPDRIIFGGPLGLGLNIYRKQLRTRLSAALPAKAKLPRLMVAKYEQFSVIYGCYFYAKAANSRKKA